MIKEIRRKVAKARGLGFAKRASGEWLRQRTTSIIVLICTIWLVLFTKQVVTRDSFQILVLFAKPHNMIFLSLLSVFLLYHGMIGMKIILEDYIFSILIRTH